MKSIRKFVRKWGYKGIKESFIRKRNRKINALAGQFRPADESVARHYAQEVISQAFPEKARSAFHQKADPSPISMPAVRTIAFYLPQFHPIAENNEWWGRGFTEWTNVSKARPQFLGHYQPHLPADLGFYDLRSAGVLRDQAEMAKSFGVSAFCFHYYWFGGRRLLEKPIETFLANKDIDIDFMFCWANENWTRRWDGREDDVLMAQSYSPEDDLALLRSMLPAFADERYLKIAGKPVLILYRASLLPDAPATVKRWQEVASEAGFPGLYVVAAQSFDIKDPRIFGCDAAVEFPPHQANPLNITATMQVVNPAYEGAIYDYSECALRFGSKRADGYKLFKTVMPGWDNEARKPGRGHTFHGNNPESFAQWIRLAAAAVADYPADERLLFVNAWNEWGEGAHLEPDQRHGYAFLNAFSRTIADISKGSDVFSLVAEVNARFSKKKSSAVFAHIFYDELMRPLVDTYLAAAGKDVDFFVSIGGGVSRESLQYLIDKCGNVRVHLSENRGRDVKPFMEMLRVAIDLGYESGIKIHGKRSPQNAYGSLWRDRLIYPLMGSEKILKKNIEALAKPGVGMTVPANFLMNLSEKKTHEGNRKWLDHILLGIGEGKLIGEYNIGFPAGTMFGFRLRCLKALVEESCFSAENFEEEAGQTDGTFAHALERVMLLLVQRDGYTHVEI